MLSFTIEADPSATAIAFNEPLIACSVGFVGRLDGVVYLYCGCSFAHQITSHLLGLDKGEVAADEMINDAMGEMGNMIVGQLKSRLCDGGATCVLTIPTVLRGDRFTIGSVSSTQRRVFFFRCGSSQLVLEALIRTPPPGR